MKVTPCEDCPCCNCSEEDCDCNLGYHMALFFTLAKDLLIYGSNNCGLESVKHKGGEFVKPEAIEVK